MQLLTLHKSLNMVFLPKNLSKHSNSKESSGQNIYSLSIAQEFLFRIAKSSFKFPRSLENSCNGNVRKAIVEKSISSKPSKTNKKVHDLGGGDGRLPKAKVGTTFKISIFQAKTKT